MLSVTSPARDIIHLSLDIFHFPFAQCSTTLVCRALKNDQWQLTNDKWKMILAVGGVEPPTSRL